MKQTLVLFIFLLAFVLFLALRPDSQPGLPILGQIAPFSLIDSQANDFGRKDLEGKIWVADFIFTTCGGVCPEMSTQSQRLQQVFADETDVHLVSISANPEQDQPENLDAYGRHYDANFNQWHFLTGPRESIHELAVESFKVGSIEDPLFHSERFILVDQNGQIRGYYTGIEPLEVDKLIRDVKKILRE